MNRLTLITTFISITSIVVSLKSATAYPIFYTCNAETLESADKIDANNVFEKIILMNQSDQQDLARSWCKGEKTCIENLKLIVSFSSLSYDIAEDIFFDELKKMKKKSIQKIEDTDLLDSILSLKQSYKKLQACQNVSNKLTPESFVHNENLLVTYPFHTNYMYVTGCNSINGKYCYPMQKENTDQVIEEAISMGTDPYLAIALTLMEEGTSMGSLYLDPIGVMDAVGCKGKQVKNNAENALNSYGTSYEIESSINKNTRLSDSLQSFINVQRDYETKGGESYYCYDTLGNTSPKVLKKPNKNSCCLKLNFESETDLTDKISHALTYEFINKRLSSKFRGRSEPEWKIQRFNGYTDLMGAAESVPSWRVGVNYYDNPGYGQQTMDYILNSLMFNPYISSKVKDVSEKYDQKWKSIMCRDKEDGTYFYDSEKYMNSIKGSKRLEVIKQKHEQGLAYEDLSQREKNVLIRELKETSKKNSKMHDQLQERVWRSYEERVSNAMDIDVEDLFIKKKLSHDELWNINKEKIKVTKNELTQVLNVWDRQDFLNERIDKLDREISEYYDTLSSSCHSMENVSDRNICLDYISKVNNVAWADEEYDPQTLIEMTPPEFIEDTSKDFLKMIDELRLTRSQSSALYKGEKQQKLMSLYNKDPAKIMSIYDQRHKVSENLQTVLNRLKKKDGYSLKVEKMIIALYKHEINTSKVSNYEEAVDEYFKSIYAQRDTLGKTSDYSWRRFSKDEIKKIVNKLKN